MKLPVVVSILLVCHGGAFSQDMDSDFRRILEDRPRVRSFILSDYHEAAKAYVKQHRNQETVDFLIREAEKPANRRLALLCLAELGIGMPAAQEALLEQASGPGGRDIVLVASYLPMDQTCLLLKELLSRSLTPQTEKSALGLLGAIGDEAVAQWLRERESQRPEAVLASAIQEIEHRLREVSPETLQQRTSQERLYWRALEETSRAYRSPLVHDRIAAEVAHKWQGQFSPDLLKEKLAKTEPLAIRLAGRQKESWAIEMLRDLATDTHDTGMRARIALAQIGSRQALSALGELITPKQNERTRHHILNLLERYGDQESSTHLRHLADAQTFEGADVARLRAAADRIQRRISAPRRGRK